MIELSQHHELRVPKSPIMVKHLIRLDHLGKLLVKASLVLLFMFVNQNANCGIIATRDLYRTGTYATLVFAQPNARSSLYISRVWSWDVGLRPTLQRPTETPLLSP